MGAYTEVGVKTLTNDQLEQDHPVSDTLDFKNIFSPFLRQENAYSICGFGVTGPVKLVGRVLALQPMYLSKRLSWRLNTSLAVSGLLKAGGIKLPPVCSLNHLIAQDCLSL